MNIKLSLTSLIFLSSITQMYCNILEDRRVMFALGCSAVVVGYLVYKNYQKSEEDDDGSNFSEPMSSNRNVGKSKKKSNSNINTQDFCGYTALHKAVLKRSLVEVEQLLADGADVDIIDYQGCTPLRYAVSYGFDEIVSLFLNYDLDIDEKYESDQSTLLMLAASKGYTDIVRLLLLHHADVNACNLNGITALWCAVYYNHMHIAQMLIAAGANINAPESSYLFTLLHNAVALKRLSLVKFLLEHGADINAEAKDKMTPLMVAFSTEEPDTEIIKLLIQSGADVHKLMEDGFTSLHVAVVLQDLEMVNMLLERQVDVHAKTDDGHTALYIAALFNREDIVKALLMHHADVNAVNEDGETPLHIAVANVDLDNNVVTTLLEYGADINAQNKDGQTPLHVALTLGLMNNAEFLILQKADVHVHDVDGYTPLYYVIFLNDYDKMKMLEALIAAGADVNAENNNHEIVLN